MFLPDPKIQRFFGGGMGPVFLTNIVCTGNESSLFECDRYGSGCFHHGDMGVTCGKYI